MFIVLRLVVSNYDSLSHTHISVNHFFAFFESFKFILVSGDFNYIFHGSDCQLYYLSITKKTPNHYTQPGVSKLLLFSIIYKLSSDIIPTPALPMCIQSTLCALVQNYVQFFYCILHFLPLQEYNL